MSKDSVYQPPNSTNTGSGSAKSSKPSPLFWTRMLRYSIYFTILGIILCLLIALIGKNAASDSNSNLDSEVSSMIIFIESIMLASRFLMVFFIMGVTSIIISLIMRGKEKKLRASQQNQII